MKAIINRLLFYFLLPVLLLVIGTLNLFNYLRDGEFGFTNLDVRGVSTDIVSTRSGELLKGDVVRGSFHSPYPNLGLVSVRFYNEDRDSDDTLIFRLKESGQDHWYYQAQYKTDQFLPHKHFPFGFPIIPDSDDKYYVFEIESTRGATGSGILIDRDNPVFIAKSSFNKDYLAKNKSNLTYFLSQKILNIFGDQENRINLFIFFLPLLIYFVYIVTDGLSYQFPIALLLIFITWDIFALNHSYDFLYLSVLFFWGLISHRYKFESRIAAVFSLLALVITPILLIFNQEIIAEKTAVWAYLFLCLTVFQQIYELKKKPKELFTLHEFLINITKLDYGIKKDIKNILILDIFQSSVIVYCFIKIFHLLKNLFINYKSFFPSSYIYEISKSTILIIFLTLLIFYVSFIIFKKINSKLTKTTIVIFITTLVITLLTGKLQSFTSQIKILSIAPRETSEAWTDITLTGKNFGDMPFVGQVNINGVPQQIILWSKEKIIFRTNPSITKSGQVVVISRDAMPSNKVILKYDFK